MLHPEKAGPSCFSPIGAIPPPIRPKSAEGGQGPYPAFLIDATALPTGLTLRPTKQNHGQIEPQTPTPIASFQQSLASTRSDWVRQ